MHPLVNIAIRAARRAGNIIARSYERLDGIEISTKAPNDFVSEVDRMAEEEIIRTIRKAYPHHGLLAEESGTDGRADYLWIIDPLDGTTNFLHGYPLIGVSIAVQHKGILAHGVIYDPLRQELFTASRGAGARLDDHRIRVHQTKGLEGTLLGTGFPFRAQHLLEIYLTTFKALFPLSAGVRRGGSAALDLAYVAAGRLDGFWEIGLKPWDLAAGALLIQEAGGMISDFSGGQQYLKTGNVVAGSPRTYQAMLKLLQEQLPPEMQQ